jgi:hypothetical protein
MGRSASPSIATCPEPEPEPGPGPELACSTSFFGSCPGTEAAALLELREVYGVRLRVAASDFTGQVRWEVASTSAAPLDTPVPDPRALRCLDHVYLRVVSGRRRPQLS